MTQQLLRVETCQQVSATSPAVPADPRPTRRARGEGAPKVVLCAADVGCGHIRAASAIAVELRGSNPAIDATVIDALTLAPAWFNLTYRDIYLEVAKRVPTLTGWLYNRTDLPGIPTGNGVAASIEALAMRRFGASPQLRDADLIICTHFLCARALSRLRDRGRISARLAVVITDQHPHAVWRIVHADLYLVASDAAATELERHGVPTDRIAVTGIPIDARFAEDTDPIRLRRKHNLPTDRPLILITGGGLGLGGIDAALNGVLSTDTDAHTVLVCGRNEVLRKSLIARLGESSSRHRILGLTQRMHELMAAADLFVGKPGGLTTSEATSKGLPMILLRPLPGQEDRNARVLVDAGAAILEADPFSAGKAAAALVATAQELLFMRRAARRFGRPTSAADAARAALQLLAVHA